MTAIELKIYFKKNRTILKNKMIIGDMFLKHLNELDYLKLSN
jgi:hypothetical protein